MKNFLGFIKNIWNKILSLFKKNKEMDVNDVTTYLQRYLKEYITQATINGTNTLNTFKSLKTIKIIIPNNQGYIFPVKIETKNIKKTIYEETEWEIDFENDYDFCDTQNVILISELYRYLNSQLAGIITELFLPININNNIFSFTTFKKATNDTNNILTQNNRTVEFDVIKNIINDSIDRFSNNTDTINGITVGTILKNRNINSLKI